MLGSILTADSPYIGQTSRVGPWDLRRSCSGEFGFQRDGPANSSFPCRGKKPRADPYSTGAINRGSAQSVAKDIRTCRVSLATNREGSKGESLKKLLDPTINSRQIAFSRAANDLRVRNSNTITQTERVARSESASDILATIRRQLAESQAESIALKQRLRELDLLSKRQANRIQELKAARDMAEERLRAAEQINENLKRMVGSSDSVFLAAAGNVAYVNNAETERRARETEKETRQENEVMRRLIGKYRERIEVLSAKKKEGLDESMSARSIADSTLFPGTCRWEND